MNKSKRLQIISKHSSRPQSISEVFLNFFKLVRINISLMVVSSCYFGTLLAKAKIDLNIFLILIATLLHSFGNSILNQYSEIDIDKKMLRTQKRPLVTNFFDKSKALISGIIAIILSLIIPLVLGKSLLVLIFLANLIIYNFIYTPLKTKTSFALLIGSISGAIPPLIGWFAAKNYISREIIMTSLVFYMWQVPHFMFLTEKYKEEYKKADIKVLINETSALKYKIIASIWLICYFILLINTIYIAVNNHIIKDIAISLETFLLIILFIIEKKVMLRFNIINLTILLYVLAYILNLVVA